MTPVILESKYTVLILTLARPLLLCVFGRVRDNCLLREHTMNSSSLLFHNFISQDQSDKLWQSSASITCQSPSPSNKTS